MNKPTKPQEKPAETSEAAGVRLANIRMPKLKKALKGIGNLGAYKLGAERNRQIADTLRSWVEGEIVRLNNGVEEDEGFFLR
jgi:hypothetical protein